MTGDDARPDETPGGGAEDDVRSDETPVEEVPHDRVGDEASVGDASTSDLGRRTCSACGREQPSIAMTCRACGAELLVGESAGRAWLRWGAVGAVVLLGAVGTFLAITALWEPHVEPETDIAWSVALGAVRDEPNQQMRSWYAAPAGEVVVLASGDALRGVARDTGRIVWRTQVEMTGDVRWDGPPTIADGTAFVAAGASLHAIDAATGEVLWTATEEGRIVQHVAVVGDAVAITTAPTGPEIASEIVLYDASTGAERSRIEASGLLDVEAGARIDPRSFVQRLEGDDERLYAAMTHWVSEEGDSPEDDHETVFGHLVALSAADGRHLWDLQVEDAQLQAHPAGSVLVVEERAEGGGSSAVAGLDPVEGTVVWRWERAEERSFHTAELVTRDRIALFEGDDETHELVLIDVVTGEEAWRTDVPPLGPSGTIAASDLGVYVSGHPSLDGAPVWAFDPATGEELWEVRVDLGEGTGPQGLEADDRGPYLLDDRGGLRGLDAADGSTQWQTAASGEAAAAAPAVHDGRVYVVGGDGLMRAIDINDGEERWSARLGTQGFSQAAVDALGAYATTGLGSIRAMDLETGDERWRTENRLESLVDEAPTPVVMDGLVIATIGGEVVAVDAESGDERWVVPLPAIGLQVGAGDGRVVAVDEGGELHAIDPVSGEARWSAGLGGGVTAVAVVDDERLVALTVDGELHLVDAADGGSVWFERFDDPVPVAPTVTEELVHLVDGGHVRALDLGSGEQRWSHDAGEALAGAVAVDGDRAYVATAGTAVIVLDGGSGEEVTRLDLGEPLGSAPAPIDGRVLVRAGEHLVALE